MAAWQGDPGNHVHPSEQGVPSLSAVPKNAQGLWRSSRFGEEVQVAGVDGLSTLGQAVQGPRKGQGHQDSWSSSFPGLGRSTSMLQYVMSFRHALSG